MFFIGKPPSQKAKDHFQKYVERGGMNYVHLEETQ